MKLSQVLFFLPSILALPSLHSLGNVDVSTSTHAALQQDCYLDFPLSPGEPVTGCQDGYDATPIIHPIFGDGNMCCKTTTTKGNDDFDKAVTTPTGLCLRVIVPADFTCPTDWELVPAGDSGWYTCCLSEKDGNNDLVKVVTTPTDICLRVLFPPGVPCHEGWESVPLGDSGFYTCCLSKTDGNDDLMVMQDKAGSQRLDALPPCTSQCSDCADVCDIATHKCYNACIDPQVSKATHKGL